MISTFIKTTITYFWLKSKIHSKRVPVMTSNRNVPTSGFVNSNPIMLRYFNFEPSFNLWPQEGLNCKLPISNPPVVTIFVNQINLEHNSIAILLYSNIYNLYKYSFKKPCGNLSPLKKTDLTTIIMI